MALKPQICKKGAPDVWRGRAWDLSFSSPSHSPDGIFLSNLDLIAKLEQEEKQWEADLCSPNGEGFHSGENCKGERRVKRAQDASGGWKCLRGTGVCIPGPSLHPSCLDIICSSPLALRRWVSEPLGTSEYLQFPGTEIPCQLLMAAIASWLKSPSQEKKKGMGDKPDAELD